VADADAGRSQLVSFVAVGLLAAFVLYQAAGTNNLPDFFIYRAGAEIALHGESPYDLPRIRALVAAQFPTENPGPDSFVNNCGYFLPPMAVLVYAPFALLPLPAAKLAWAVLTAAAGLAVTKVPNLFRRAGNGLLAAGPVWGMLVPFLLLVNFLAFGIARVGQTTLLCVGCVAAGQWCFERGRSVLGCVLWAVPFIKPHLALALLPLAWYLGGWKRAAGVLGVVAGLNLVGATVAGGSPLFLRDYVDFLSSGHKAVVFNLAGRNPEITSWNRLLFALTEPSAGDRFLVEQTAAMTLASYLIWFGLVAGRCALTGARPSPAWAVAAASVGAVFCPQVLAYEVFFLALVVPWVRELFDGGWRVYGWAAAALLGAQLISFETAAKLGIEFHRPLAAALLAMLVLVGPLNADRGAKPRGS
jgi:hypothetical protein